MQNYVTLYYEVCSIARKLRWTFKLHLAMTKNYSTYQLGHFSAWKTTKIFSHEFLWENLTIELSQAPFCFIKKKLTIKAPPLLVKHYETNKFTT